MNITYHPKTGLIFADHVALTKERLTKIGEILDSSDKQFGYKALTVTINDKINNVSVDITKKDFDEITEYIDNNSIDLASDKDFLE